MMGYETRDMTALTVSGNLNFARRGMAMRKVLAALGMTAAIAGGGVPALGANLVTNPGFEADDAAFASSSVLAYATGWNVSGDAGETNAFPNTGSGSAFIANGSLSQALSTTIGDTYNISFFVGVDDFSLGTDTSAIFDATFGTADLLAGGVTGADVGGAVGLSGYEEFTARVVASSSSTTLTFTGTTTGSDGPWYLDDINVEAAAIAVPEPSSLLLVLSVLAAVPLMWRRA